MQTKILLSLLFCCLTSSSLFAEKSLRVGTIAPNGSLWTKSLRSMGKEIAQKTNGAVKISVRVYARGDQVEKDILRRLSERKLDGALFLQSGLDSAVPQLALLKLPYFYRDYQQWQQAQGIVEKSVANTLTEKKLVVLSWLDSGFAYLFSRSQIKTLQNFRKAKTWLYSGDPLIESCFREIRVHGVALPVSAVKEALQKDTIDCVYSSPYLLIALGWHDKVDYCIDLPISNVIGGLVFNEDSYKKIPAKHRRKVASICRKHMRRLARKVQEENELAIKLLREKYRVQFASPPAKLTAQLHRFGQQIAEKQVGKSYPRNLLDAVKN